MKIQQVKKNNSESIKVEEGTKNKNIDKNESETIRVENKPRNNSEVYKDFRNHMEKQKCAKKLF